MPLWLVIVVLGAAGSGYLLLKAREAEKVNVLKRIKAGHKSVVKAAKHVAKRPSTMPVYEPPSSAEQVQISPDLSSRVAKDLEEIMEKKDL